jgi:hypothetical protein
LEANAAVSAGAKAIAEMAGGAIASATHNISVVVVVDKGVKVQQPPSILKRKFSLVDSSKPAVPAMEEEKKDNDDSSGSA